MESLQVEMIFRTLQFVIVFFFNKEFISLHFKYFPFTDDILYTSKSNWKRFYQCKALGVSSNDFYLQILKMARERLNAALSISELVPFVTLSCAINSLTISMCLYFPVTVFIWWTSVIIMDNLQYIYSEYDDRLWTIQLY